MRSSVLTAFGLAIALSLVGCGQSATHGKGGTGGGDTSDAGVYNGDGDTSIDPGSDPDKPCSEMKFAPMKVGDPDIILIQDTSGSMADGTPSKYDQVVSAVSTVIGSLEQQMSPVQWGLVVFPNDAGCGVAKAPTVPVGPMHGQQVVDAIKAKSPNGNTPLSTAIQNATAYYGTLNDGRTHNFLIATDGEPNCDNGMALPMFCKQNADCPKGQTCQQIPLLGGVCMAQGGGQSVTDVMNAKAKGIKTYVVGISLNGVSATMNALADAGGTSRGGAVHYYPVTDQASLEQAFKTIAGEVISCTFKVDSLPMDNQMIVVSVDGTEVAQDTNHMNGWDFDAMTMVLTFYGQACASLQAHPGTVSVGYTCPPPS